MFQMLLTPDCRHCCMPTMPKGQFVCLPNVAVEGYTRRLIEKQGGQIGIEVTVLVTVAFVSTPLIGDDANDS